ncbi:uncharacterized protein LOC110849719 [Folsomia candida]|uniref:uncharacterized protein LOC110849719 n=1 Tax=Folsomia candida TaxID=158441 RepID=UPI000B8F63D6|nr:uncharacterized protein LOC110849719 [Folsomia candida]
MRFEILTGQVELLHRQLTQTYQIVQHFIDNEFGATEQLKLELSSFLCHFSTLSTHLASAKTKVDTFIGQSEPCTLINEIDSGSSENYGVENVVIKMEVSDPPCPIELEDIELFPEQWSGNASTAIVKGRRAVKRSKNAGENCENDSDSDYVPPPSEDSHQSELSDTVVFQKSDDLGELIQLAEGEKKLTKICFVCQKEFYTTSGLANHMSRHDKDAKSTKELNHRRRMRGLEYVGYSKVEASSTGAKIIQVKKTPRSGRRLGPACTSCTKSKIRKCVHFSEEVRKELFDNFWISMDWKAKKSYVRGLVDVIQDDCQTTQHHSRRKI